MNLFRQRGIFLAFGGVVSSAALRTCIAARRCAERQQPLDLRGGFVAAGAFKLLRSFGRSEGVSPRVNTGAVLSVGKPVEEDGKSHHWETTYSEPIRPHLKRRYPNVGTW